MGEGSGVPFGPNLILDRCDGVPQRVSTIGITNLRACFSTRACAPRCPRAWQVKIERVLVRDLVLDAVHPSQLSTCSPVPSLRSTGLVRYRVGMPRVGAARPPSILFLASLRGKESESRLAECR